MESLPAEHDLKLAGAIRRAEIHRQEHGIDVLACIHDEDSTGVILIDDKTHTLAHGDQLQRYRNLVCGGKTKLGEVPEHWSAYLETGNQSLAEDAQDTGWCRAQEDRRPPRGQKSTSKAK